MRKPKYQNDLYVVRRERGLSQKEVAAILGQRSSRELSKYERGVKLPPLQVALRLEIVYRRPVAFLYSFIYNQLRDDVRAREEKSREQLMRRRQAERRHA